MWSDSDSRLRSRLCIAMIGTGLLIAVGPPFWRLAAQDGVARANVPGDNIVGRQVVPIDNRVVIHRAIVQVRAIVLAGMTDPIPPAPGDWSRPQVRKLDIPADEQFLFRVKRVLNDRVQVASPDGQISGWLKRDQIVPLEQAEEHFGRAIEKNKRDSGTFRLRARVRGVKRNWAGALADLDEAIRLDPKSAAGYRARSDVESCMGDLDAAMVDFDVYVRLESKQASFYLACARNCLDRNQTGRALLDLLYAEGIEPEPLRNSPGPK